MVSAFRARVRTVHPDANAGAGDPERVALLVRARSTLTGPGREAYANALRAHRAMQAARATPPKPTEPPFDWDETFRKVTAQAKIDLARDEERERERERDRQARARAGAEVEQAWAGDSFERNGLSPDWYDLEAGGIDYLRRARARTEELLHQSRTRVEAQVARTRAEVDASCQRTRDSIERQRRQTQEAIERSRAEVVAAYQRTRDGIERQMRQTQEAIDRTLRRYR